MRAFRSIAVVVAAIVTLLSFGLASSFAQGATPTAPPGAAQGVEYPVAVHAGTCPTPTAEPEFNLGNTIVAGSDVAEAQFIGQTPGQPALVSSNTADISLDDLAGSPRVIALHKSADEFQTLVACGTISGSKANGELVMTLQPVEDSGVSGVAILTENDSKTDIKIYVLSPEATPATPGA